MLLERNHRPRRSGFLWPSDLPINGPKRSKRIPSEAASPALSGFSAASSRLPWLLIRIRPGKYMLGLPLLVPGSSPSFLSPSPVSLSLSLSISTAFLSPSPVGLSLSLSNSTRTGAATARAGTAAAASLLLLSPSSSSPGLAPCRPCPHRPLTERGAARARACGARPRPRRGASGRAGGRRRRCPSVMPPPSALCVLDCYRKP